MLHGTTFQSKGATISAQENGTFHVTCLIDTVQFLAYSHCPEIHYLPGECLLFTPEQCKSLLYSEKPQSFIGVGFSDSTSQPILPSLRKSVY